jgi:glycerol kinase
VGREPAILPEIVDCAGPLGETLAEHFGAPIPICGLAGDQQAASIGQACLAPGNSKATYGTGAFILTNTGGEFRRSRHRLLSTIAWQLAGQRATRSKARCSSPEA